MIVALEDVLRVLDELQSLAKSVERCPANWHKGEDTMKGDPEGSKQYFEKH